MANFLSINQNVQLRRKKKKLESWKQWKAESKKSLTDKMKTFEEFGRKKLTKDVAIAVVSFVSILVFDLVVST